ncbi:uncharacterized protein LOC130547863 isoform X2 [Triplophysa rosa]|uniref:uncharacterized protein LOC130547863 isoform X2 n=1 Tax=Triplophysa rosa TaxID=992332 RepID=UPI0025461740|nr:uncharacterized protein LOC130547863 isoform X2 [Triplophysa rosa]
MMRRDFEKMPDAVSRTWLQGTVREKMREHLKIFKDIMTSRGSQSTKFLVSSKDHTIHPGSCILLNENGSDEDICFTPPSKPACPIIIQVRGHSVVLKMPSSCPVTVELKLLYKMKEEREWKSQYVHKRQTTVTLTDLSPDTHYEIKYEAIGRLNYTLDSNVIQVTTVNTEEECKSSNSDNSLLEYQTEDETQMRKLAEVIMRMGDILDADDVSFQNLLERSRISWTSCLLLVFQRWMKSGSSAESPAPVPTLPPPIAIEREDP